jgi:hypothetical protein
MYSGHICAAGIDVESGRRVRPVARAQLPSSMLSTRGGVFDIGNVVELGRTRWQGSPPEVEDVLFDPRAAKVARRLSGDEFISALRKRLAPGLIAIGPALVRENNSMITPRGMGRCSLVATAADGPVQIAVRTQRNTRGDQEKRIRFVRSDGVDLSVTDVRLYQPDMLTPDDERVTWLQERLAGSPEVILCFGLGRPYNDRHYLQLNNLHLSNAAGWQLDAS